MDRFEYIERSLRCFWFSLVGLVPVFGLPLAVLSLFNAVKLRRATNGSWDPARNYQIWATIFSCLGIFASIIACFILAAIIANRLAQTLN